MRRKTVALWMLGFMLLQAGSLYGAEDVTKYYPLKPGQSWTYTMTTAKGGPQRIVVTNMPARELKGVTLTPRKWEVGGATKYYLVGADDYGVYRYGEQASEQAEPVIAKPKVYYLKSPLSNGTSWDIRTRLGSEEVTVNLTIEAVNEEVKVPAGTYKDCLKVKHAGSTQKGDTAITLEAYEWYAPDVGLVKSIVTLNKQEKKQPKVSEHLSYQLESFKP